MRVFSLFELFLVVFGCYAIIKYEGGMRFLVPILCLVTVFLFERLRKNPEEDEKNKKRLLKHDQRQYKQYSIEEERSLSQSEGWSG
jgi:hypothetical protein